MDKLLIPRISEKIEERKRKYNDYILKAEEINKKALETLNTYEKKLSAAKNEAMKQITTNEKDLENFIREKEDEINERLKQKIAENDAKLILEKNEMLTRVDDLSKSIALSIAERLELSSISKQDIEVSATEIGLK